MTDTTPATDEEVAAFKVMLSRDSKPSWYRDTVAALIARVEADEYLLRDARGLLKDFLLYCCSECLGGSPDNDSPCARDCTRAYLGESND